MAAIVVGLYLLMLGTSGLVKAIQYSEYDNIFRRHPWDLASQLRYKNYRRNPISHFNWNFEKYNPLSQFGPWDFRNIQTDYNDEIDSLEYNYKDDSPTLSKILPVLDSEPNISSVDSQYVTATDISFKSQPSTATSPDVFGQITSQKTVDTSESDSANLNPESNSLLSKNPPEVTNAENRSPTQKLGTEAENVSDNTDALSTEESSLENEISEVTSTTGNGENCFDDDKTLSTQETTAAATNEIPTENPSSVHSSSDDSIPQTTEAPDEEQTESSTSFYSESEEIQTQTTISSVTETLNSISSTTGKDFPASIKSTTVRDFSVSSSTATNEAIISSKTETSNSILSSTEKDLPASITSTTEKDFPTSITSTTEKDFPASITSTTVRDFSVSSSTSTNDAITSSKTKTSNSISSTTEKYFPVLSSTATDEAKTANYVSSTPVEHISVSLSTSRDEAISSTTTEFISGSITESVTQDHIIRISSIRTARVVISVVFIAIALIAATVLAIYMFRVKRRAIQYDQLMLLP